VAPAFVLESFRFLVVPNLHQGGSVWDSIAYLEKWITAFLDEYYPLDYYLMD
jgi:hypothetical protein